ncbi:hypothetical protein HXX76_011328 [Chlamydomonas incerta]|uniref:Uncharacterized protein n=1 Tax=Chlamydomonas incerta TaxID=51695 RepID=A0A835VX42_CHLIN|nr:hypothetical protein HXX76_011328 [Chlamydomonas incerta]|eukprot:KAG2429088.1 hypothetical protein HXX76_011328 [Chlamydomonas incerta]
MAVTEDYTGLSSRVDVLEQRFEKTAKFDDRGYLTASNDLQNINCIYATGLTPDATSNSVLEEIGKHIRGFTFSYDMVQVYKQKDGNMAAKIWVAPIVRQALLSAWRGLFSAHARAVREAVKAQQLPPAPPTSLQLREDLTRAGREQYGRLKETYNKLKQDGLRPQWRNGAELWYHPNGQDQKHPEPYKPSNSSSGAASAGGAAGSPGAKGASSSRDAANSFNGSPCRETPVRGGGAKRGARTPGTGRRTDATGDDAKKKQDQGSRGTRVAKA